MMRLARQALLCLGMIAATVHVAGAQDMLRAAAVVNDEVISMLDLEMRLRLALISSGLQDTPELRSRLVSQVMRNLIDERLQAQEAARLDIKVTEQQVDNAVEQIAANNNMTREAFLKQLASRGVLVEAFLEQIRGQLTWRALVSRRLRPSVQITDDEIEEVVDRVTANRGTVIRRISEIFLGVDSPAQESEVRQNAQRLFEELRAGADFAALAQQFSESAAAPRGGDLGWIQDGQLPDELEGALAAMQPGSLSQPIRTLAGYHIIWLREQRQASVGEVTLGLTQIFFEIPSGAPAAQQQAVIQRAGDARAQVDGCDGLDSLARSLGSPGSGDLGTVKLGDLPRTVRDAVQSLPIGQPSAPVGVAGGIAVLVVCERTESGIDRNRIREQLTEQRLSMLTRRFMRDLRRNANVDIRI